MVDKEISKHILRISPSAVCMDVCMKGTYGRSWSI